MSTRQMLRKILGFVLTTIYIFCAANLMAEGLYESDSNTVLLLHFDEGEGMPLDNSGKGNNSRLKGTSWNKEGKFGSCLEFDGVDDRVDVIDDDSLDLSGDFTVELWVKTSVDFSVWRSIIDKRGGGTINYCLLITRSGKVAFEIYDGTDNPTVKSQVVINDGEWHHLAGIRDTNNGMIALYLDGALQESTPDITSTTARGITNKAVVSIGRINDVDRYFKGLIDEVRISNTVRYGRKGGIMASKQDKEKVKIDSYFKAPAKGKNLVHNGSFELGFKDWERMNTHYSGLGKIKWEMDSSNSMHGNKCLKVIHRDTELTSEIWSRLIPVEKEGQYTLSVYLKGEGENIKAVLGGKRINISERWQRHSVDIRDHNVCYWQTKGNLPKGVPHTYCVRIGFKGKGAFWIDATQFEKGEISSYEQPKTLEVGIDTNKRNNIFHLGEPISLFVNLFNGSNKKSHSTLSCQIKDYYKETVFEKKMDFDVPSNQGISKTIKINLKKKGIFRGIFTLKDNQKEVKEKISFAVISPFANTNEDPFFGLNMGGEKSNFELGINMAKQIGASWLSCYNPDQYDFFFREGIDVMDLAVNKHRTIRKHGMNFFTMAGRGTPMEDSYYHNLSSQEMEEVVNKWVNCYAKYISRFKNETRFHEVGAEFPNSEILAKVYAKAIKGIYPKLKEIDPLCTVIGGGSVCGGEHASSMVGWLLEEGAFPYLDVISIHPYCVPRSPEKAGYRKGFRDLKRLISEYGEKDIWITELGWKAVDVFYTDFPYYYRGAQYSQIVTEKRQAGYLVRANVIARAEGIKNFCSFVLHGESIAKPYVYGFTNGCFSSPKTVYVAYNTMANILSGAEFIKEIDITDIVRCYIFKVKDGLVAVLWSFDEEAGKVKLGFNQPLENVDVIDLMGNPLDLKTSSLELDGSPLFLRTAGDRRSFIDFFKKAEVIDIDRPVKVKISFSPRPKELMVSIENISSKRLKGCETELIVPQGWKVIGDANKRYDLKPGETREIPFLVDMVIVPGVSYEVLANTFCGEKTIKTVWRPVTSAGVILCYKASLPITIDASLDEWKKEYFAFLGEENMGGRNKAKWEGDDDHSALFSTAWDSNYFYFAAEVRDDKFNQLYTELDVWKGDSIQIAFDTLNDSIEPGYDENDCEYNLALTRKGPQCFISHGVCGKSRGLAKNVKVAIKRVKDKIYYEIAIPFDELGLPKGRIEREAAVPEELRSAKVRGVDRIMGFNTGIIDNDGDENKLKWLQITKGILGGKAPSQFKDLIFATE